MIIPTVHLNGTSKKELMRQVTDVFAAVETAIQAMHRAYPHGRDYYPQGTAAIGKAVKQHLDLVAKLVEVQGALGELGRGIQDQPANRSEI
jgi:hypothetical protein